jgi:hypothetical protein
MKGLVMCCAYVLDKGCVVDAEVGEDDAGMSDGRCWYEYGKEFMGMRRFNTYIYILSHENLGQWS